MPAKTKVVEQVESIIAKRDTTHGNWKQQSRYAQELKTFFAGGKNFHQLTPSQRDALEQVATKISRVMCGDPGHVDHWNDIAGYAKLGGSDD